MTPLRASPMPFSWILRADEMAAGIAALLNRMLSKDSP